MPQQNKTPQDPLWFKDAIIYELHIKAFQDSNADGIGDFNGLIQRLDYLQDLGITAIWLLPLSQIITPSIPTTARSDNSKHCWMKPTNAG